MMTLFSNIFKQVQQDKKTVCFFNGICLTENICQNHLEFTGYSATVVPRFIRGIHLLGDGSRGQAAGRRSEILSGLGIDAHAVKYNEATGDLHALPSSDTHILMIYDDYDQEQVFTVDKQAKLSIVLIYLNKVGHRLVVEQSEASQVNLFQIAIDSTNLSNAITFNLQGESAQCHINGIQFANGQQSVTTQLAVIHQVANAVSNINYKSIADQKADIKISAHIKVLEEAVKANSETNLNNILLSNSASIDTAPELEIYADDVKCSHGATVGDLNEDSLFYLISRGIDLQQAKAMLLQAFMQPLIDQLDPVIQPYITNKMKYTVENLA